MLSTKQIIIILLIVIVVFVTVVAVVVVIVAVVDFAVRWLLVCIGGRTCGRNSRAK